MRKFRHLINFLCLVGAVMVIFNNSVASAQQEDTVVRCRFETPSINIGADTILYLEVIDVEDLFAFQLEVTFNPELVEVFGDYPEYEKMVLGDFLSSDFELYNEIHNGYGAVLMAITQHDPTPPQSGSGVLAYGYVSGKQEGTVDFVFEELIVMDPDSEDIPYRLENCSLTIQTGEQATDTPTSTFTPTQTLPTPGDTLTPEPTFTSSPTETTQPSPSSTPQLSDTATISPTPQINETPTVSPIPLPSDIPTIGFSPTPLPSLVITTETPYPSNTPTVTQSPTVTSTVIPEPTPRPFNSVYVVLSLTFCLAMFAVIAVLAGVLWYMRQSK